MLNEIFYAIFKHRAEGGIFSGEGITINSEVWIHFFDKYLNFDKELRDIESLLKIHITFSCLQILETSRMAKMLTFLLFSCVVIASICCEAEAFHVPQGSPSDQSIARAKAILDEFPVIDG